MTLPAPLRHSSVNKRNEYLSKARFSSIGFSPDAKKGGYIDHQPITKFTNSPRGES